MPETPSRPTGVPDPEPAAVTTTGLAPNVAAGLACLFTIVGGVVFLVLEKKNQFVRFWAMQAVFLGGLILGVSIVVRLANAIFGLIPILGKLLIVVLGVGNMVFGLAWLIAYVLAVVKAFTNQEWEIPWLGKLARQQLAKMDAAASPPTA
jgi:uncharacterized membrane protein